MGTKIQASGNRLTDLFLSLQVLLLRPHGLDCPRPLQRPRLSARPPRDARTSGRGCSGRSRRQDFTADAGTAASQPQPETRLIDAVVVARIVVPHHAVADDVTDRRQTSQFGHLAEHHRRGVELVLVVGVVPLVLLRREDAGVLAASPFGADDVT